MTIHYNAIICPSLKKSAIIADLCIVLRESCLVFPAGTGKKAPMTLKSYKELDVWQKGVEIVDKIYSLTVTFPKEEQYGLTAQMCRSAVSVPSNIAEGFSRSHTPEYVQFLRIALGSLAELDTQSTIAHRRKYMDGNSADELAENMDHEARMLMSLIKSLKNRKDSQSESRTPNHKPRVTSE